MIRRSGDFITRSREVETATIRPPIIEAYVAPVVKVIEPIAPKVTTYIPAPAPLVKPVIVKPKPVFAPTVKPYIAPPPPVVKPIFAPIVEAIFTRPKIIAPIIRAKKPIEIETFAKVIARPKVETVVAKRIEEKKFSEILVNKAIQNVQTKLTKLVVVEKSPDIRTGVCGKIAPMPVSLGHAEIPVKYPDKQVTIGIPQQPSPTKEKELKAGKLNVLDKFFLWLNAILK